MGVHRTCGEPGEVKKNTHPKTIFLPLVVAGRHGVERAEPFGMTYSEQGHRVPKAGNKLVRLVRAPTRSTPPYRPSHDRAHGS